eukprot:gb/GECG01014266.1/.p1 GENE.gb/GECG01014266.1/~~gb/GECG01014266.1/.p1  ORF type:complete len:137 (+),score=7.04 gb/GECG01014266.1/:1-411(+)
MRNSKKVTPYTHAPVAKCALASTQIVLPPRRGKIDPYTCKKAMRLQYVWEEKNGQVWFGFHPSSVPRMASTSIYCVTPHAVDLILRVQENESFTHNVKKLRSMSAPYKSTFEALKSLNHFMIVSERKDCYLRQPRN